eukprot:scaffold60228_cov69-Phaeocystis_antarctica.AAC.1
MKARVLLTHAVMHLCTIGRSLCVGISLFGVVHLCSPRRAKRRSQQRSSRAGVGKRDALLHDAGVAPRARDRRAGGLHGRNITWGG